MKPESWCPAGLISSPLFALPASLPSLLQWRTARAPFVHVKFADFWLADQLNSLTFILPDLAFFVCFYICRIDWLSMTIKPTSSASNMVSNSIAFTTDPPTTPYQSVSATAALAMAAAAVTAATGAPVVQSTTAVTGTTAWFSNSTALPVLRVADSSVDMVMQAALGFTNNTAVAMSPSWPSGAIFLENRDNETVQLRNTSTLIGNSEVEESYSDVMLSADQVIGRTTLELKTNSVTQGTTIFPRPVGDGVSGSPPQDRISRKFVSESYVSTFILLVPLVCTAYTKIIA
ncbi:unnamed protein product [Protopolystoma xenopodis]|uniref:EXS domain-containing protein n=1 Tax=Protopolystoma xenopodis TaxID=117903 RepID=A0A3S4ZSU0_9PLAT|nr:unnamed protein product [Protopolystoma xenopodis]